MTRCLDRRWTATQKHIDWKTKKKKVATACVKSMQISLNEQWPLNLNTSMTIHIYRIVSWYVLTLSLHNDWIPIKTSHRQTHNEREKSAEPDACTHTHNTCASWKHAKVKRMNERTKSIQWREDACVLIKSIDNIHVSIVYMENGMHHESQLKRTVHKTKKR